MTVTKRKLGQHLPAMKDLDYHYGLKMKMYPSYQQIKIIDYNGNTNRFLYNEKVAHSKLKYRFKRYWELQNPSDYELLTLQYWKNKLIYPQTTCLPLLRSRMLNSYIFSVYLTDAQRSKTIPWMNENRKLQDSLMPKQCRKNYQFAWNQYKKVSKTNVPCFHVKSYQVSYQTACSYSRYQDTQLYNGSVRFLDNSHIVVPKIGKIRVAGSIQRILDLTKNQLIRIGTVTITHNSDNSFTLSLQLGSNYPFVNVPKKISHVKTALGIDLNTSNFLTDSTGHVIDNPRYYRRSLKRLKRLQRQLSKKQRRAKKEGRNLRESKN